MLSVADQLVKAYLHAVEVFDLLDAAEQLAPLSGFKRGAGEPTKVVAQFPVLHCTKETVAVVLVLALGSVLLPGEPQRLLCFKHSLLRGLLQGESPVLRACGVPSKGCESFLLEKGVVVARRPLALKRLEPPVEDVFDERLEGGAREFTTVAQEP